MKKNPSIDRLLAEAVAAGAAPGVVAMAADRDGITYEGASGVRELGKDAPMTSDTVTWLASMTKAVTGAAAMQCVERGQIGLDQPAGEIVPALAKLQVLEGFAVDGKPKLRPAKKTVTLRNLLTHSAGFTYTIWNEDAVRYEQVTGMPNILSGLDKSIEVPLQFEPGERWEYGQGIDWAGKLVEKVSGQRLGAFMKENLFEPLGMKSTAFDLTPDLRKRLAAMHTRTPDGTAVMPLEMAQDAEHQAGGHALYSTAQDYLRFTQMILHGGTLGGARVLKPETVALMSQNQMGDCTVKALPTAAPHLSNDCDFYPGIPCKWGLSFMINTKDTPEGRSAGSLSWAGLCNSYYWIDPKKQVTGLLMTQLFPFFDEKVMALFRAFEKAVYAQK